jgi:hypothetical protein
MHHFPLKPFELLERTAGLREGNRTCGWRRPIDHVVGAMAVKSAAGERRPHERAKDRDTCASREKRFHLFALGMGANPALCPFARKCRMHDPLLPYTTSLPKLGLIADRFLKAAGIREMASAARKARLCWFC